LGHAIKRRLLVSLGGVLALFVSFGLGLLVRPSLHPLLVKPDLSVHESRSSLHDWKDGRLQVLANQWKLTGERDRSDGRDELIWLWRTWTSGERVEAASAERRASTR
jgi:hypothetical protein